MNQEAYTNLINQDISEIEKHLPDSLEKKHIIVILQHSIINLYNKPILEVEDG